MGSIRSPSPAEARLIDQACDRFEAVWKSGCRPNPGDYVKSSEESLRPALLRQLLLLDWDYRIRAGDTPTTDEYRARFSGDAAVIDAVGREMNTPPASTREGGNGQPTIHSDKEPANNGALEAPEAISIRYDIGGEIGHGGIGVVFRCRDRLLGRELAIKVLRDAYADRPDARQRFVAEAQVGSCLQHPAIVPVYELGWFDDRRPYITMKLVEGYTLAERLNDRPRGANGAPLAELPRWLSVFEQVCQAMAYAHSRGVVHRDLKPANIMVGAFGEVQVMDWGFAKQLRISDFGLRIEERDQVKDLGSCETTQSGAMMGTPAYMPPEQARGEVALIDARTDVFALGAILCEILTGRPPYSGNNGDEICQLAVAGDLTGARSRLDVCGAERELCDLARRCLNADREQRPTDAGVVAKELTTYLSSAQERLRQVQLQEAAAQARAVSERRGRRLSMALAAALLIGAGAATWQAVVATHAKDDAQASATAARDAKEIADAKELEARSILEFVVSKVFARARPKWEPGGMGPDVTIRDAAKAALPFVNKSFLSQPLIEARLRFTLGKSFYLLGDAKTAAEQFQIARTIFTTHDQAANALDCMTYLANSYEMLRLNDQALELYKQVLAIQTASLGPDHMSTLSATMNVGTSLYRLGRFADSIDLHEKLKQISKERFGLDHTLTLMNMYNLANSYYAIGRRGEALALREEVLNRRKAIRDQEPGILLSMMAVGNSYNSAGRYAEALKLLDFVVARQKVTLGHDHPDTLSSMNNLGNSYAGLRRYDEELKLRLETLSLKKAARGEDHPETLRGMSNLASAYMHLRRYTEASELLQETIAKQEERLGPDDPETLTSKRNLAVIFADTGRPAEAFELHNIVLTRRRAVLAKDHPDLLSSLEAVASCLIKLGREDEAMPLLTEALRNAVSQTVSFKLVADMADRRMRHFLAKRDAAECRSTAELWEDLHRADPPSLIVAVRIRALTAAMFSFDENSSESAVEADRAMVWLKQAVAAGYKDAAKLKTNKDFDILRNRDDFKKLISNLTSAP